MGNEKNEAQKVSKDNDGQNTFDIPKIVAVALRKCHHVNNAKKIADKAFKLTVEERAALLKFFDCESTDLVFEIKKFWLGDNFITKTKQYLSME